MKEKLFISTILFFTIFSVFSQEQNIDSLLQYLNTSQNVDEQIKTIKEITKYYSGKDNYSKTLFYAKKGIDISKKNNNIEAELSFTELIGNVYHTQGNYDKSISYYYKLLIDSTKSNNFLYYKGTAYQGFSKNYWRKADFEKAVFYSIEAVKIFEMIDDKYNIIVAKLNLANIYITINEIEKGELVLDEILESDFLSENEDAELLASIYEKKGVVNFYKKDYKLARKNYFKSIELFRKTNSDLDVAIEIGNIGETFEMGGDLKKAIIYYKKAIVAEEDFKYFSGLIFLYEAIGRTFFKLKKYNLSEQSYKRALKYCKNTGETRELPLIYSLLHELYSKKGDYKNAYKFSLMFSQIKDSISGIEVKNKISELRINFETEKKEQENIALKKKEVLKDKIIELQKNKNKNQILIIFFISFWLLTSLILSVRMYYLFKNKKELSQDLDKRNRELRLVNNEIIYSINYARKIQLAILESSEYVKKYFSDYFILNIPLSTVSGDFYWARKIKNKVFFAVGDCTGHGIPAAFLTVLGTSLLNEIVTDDKLQTNIILDILRKKIKLSLNQKGNIGDQHDGMDISFCSLDLITKELQFSGAYSSVYIKKTYSANEGLLVLKADRQPLGMFLMEKPFSKQTIILEEGDILYLASDGFSDQFNIDGTRKYYSKRFKKLLFDNSNKTFAKQKEILENEYKTWKGDFDQVDDILVVGVKI